MLLGRVRGCGRVRGGGLPRLWGPRPLLQAGGPRPGLPGAGEQSSAPVLVSGNQVMSIQQFSRLRLLNGSTNFVELTSLFGKEEAQMLQFLFT